MVKCLFLWGIGWWLLALNQGFSQTLDSVPAAVISPPVAVKYFMVLDKPGPVHRLRFYPGNTISFKLHGDRRRYRGQITDIKKNSLVLWDAEIPLRDITKIKIDKISGAAGSVNFLGRLLQGAGGLFTMVGLSNYVLDVEYGDHSLEFLKYSVSALAAGTIMTRATRSRAYKINQNRRLKTIEQFW